MEQDQHDHLFDLRLNRAGIVWATRFSKLIGWVVVLWALMMALHVLTAYITIRSNDGRQNETLFQWLSSIFPFYTLVTTPLLAVQLWYYWKIGKNLKESIRQGDEILFNETFRAMFMNAFFGLVMLVLNVILEGLWTYCLVKLYLSK